MTPVQAVLWDMDGTLIDSEPVSIDALARAMREHGLRVPDNLFERVVGVAADEIYRWCVADLGLRLEQREWETAKLRHHLAAGDRIAAIADAVEVFRRLDALGVPQAVVSNSDRIIVDFQLGHVGLTRPGLVTVSRNDVRAGKPDPEGYLRAAWLLGVDPAACTVVEDSPSGARAGIAAGMATVLVPTAHAAPPAGARLLHSLDDLLSAAAPQAAITGFPALHPE